MTAQLPDHLMVSSTDGGLYDTRKLNWHKAPIRPQYRSVFRDIKTTQQLKATMRQKYAWPGGYEIAYFTSDGALLCHDCVRRHLRSVLWSIHNQCSDGWRVIGAGYEATPAPERHIEQEDDTTSYCAHCSRVFGEIC
jgi:hypothetical protein